MKQCRCKENEWEFKLDSKSQGWIKCRYCGDSMFEDDIGVILINWIETNPNNLRVEIKE